MNIDSTTIIRQYFINPAMSWLKSLKTLGVLFAGMLLILTGYGIFVYVTKVKKVNGQRSYGANVMEASELGQSSSAPVSTSSFLGDDEGSRSSSTIAAKEKKVLFTTGSSLGIESVTTLTATPLSLKAKKGATSLAVDTESSTYLQFTTKEVIPLVATPLPRQNKEGITTKAKEESPSSSMSSVVTPKRVSMNLFLNPDEHSFSSSTEQPAPSTTSSENWDKNSPSIDSSAIAEPLEGKSEESSILISSSMDSVITEIAPTTSEPLEGKSKEVVPSSPSSTSSAITQTVPVTPTQSGVLNSWRSPKSVIPESYDLYLYPDLKTGLFKGSVSIKVDIKEDVKEIRLHSDGLELDSVNVDGKMANFNLHRGHELVIISFEDGKNFGKGDKILDIQYHGSMKDRIVGLYRSVYMNEKNEKRAIVCSKFEPTDARKAFPCFDEPQFKAEYAVHIAKPKDSKYICLSNMPEEGKPAELADGYLVNFNKTVKMSTYLLCFIVCDFVYTESFFNSCRGEKIPLRVYSSAMQAEKTEHALKEAKNVMEYFLEYCQADYPLPKLDLIGIPEFCSGAMEHWGLVTFRETELFYDKNTSSVTTKESIARVIAHELSHMWFGNLVTMKWWSDLWLNEGFASFIQYKGVDHLHPDWQMMDQFQMNILHPLLAMDATVASHPIIQPVETPDQIAGLFDFVTYNKGSSVLRMLENAITEKKFQEGIRMYLKTFAWGSVTSDDLWGKLEEQIGESCPFTIKQFMDTWTLQKGYPVLTITIKDDKYVITQERFLINSEDKEDEESVFGYRWTIPVTYITYEDQENPKLVWFDHTHKNITIEIPKTNWVKFNHQQIGLYRVNYPPQMWKTLTVYMPLLRSPSNRSHLLEEAFSLAEHGPLSYDIPLSLTKHLTLEHDYMPWAVAITKLQQLRKYLSGSSVYPTYLSYVKYLIRHLYDKLGWRESISDHHLTKKLRLLIFSFACSGVFMKCRKEAKKKFEEWLDNPSTYLPKDLRMVIYKYGVKDSKIASWHKLFEIFKREPDANEKLNLLVGLASTKEPQLLKRMLEFGKDEEIISRQDYFPLLRILASNPIGSPIVWDFMRENWQYLVDRFGLNDINLGALIPAVTCGFTTHAKLIEMEIFFANNPDAGTGAGARKIALATVKNNIRWVTRNTGAVEKWFRENVKRRKSIGSVSTISLS